MAFTNPWDETRPDDSTAIREGDDWIRRNATAVRERLAVEHYAYADETGKTNVGKHKPGSAKILVGLASAKPLPDSSAPGTLYFETDTGLVKRDTGTAWETVTTLPIAHASSHAANGADPVTPAAIGAETPAGAQEKINTHAANPSAHHTRYTDAEAVAAILAADGVGSGLDADYLRGLVPGTSPNNVLQLDASGKVPASCLPPIQQRFLYYGDETECSATGTAETSIKDLRVVKCSAAGLNVAKLSFVATLKVAGGTGYLKVYVDGVPVVTLQTTSTSYALVWDSASVSWSDNTVHTVEARISNSGAYATYNQVFEVYVE